MQFQVPQFIETEDKIVGPLTLKQFGFIGTAGIIIFGLFFVLEFPLWLLVSVILGGAGVALAFGKMNGRPITIFLSSFISGIWQPRVYVFKPSVSKHGLTASTSSGVIVKPEVELAPHKALAGKTGATKKKAPLFGGVSGLRSWIATSKNAIPRREKPLPKNFGRPQKEFKERYEVVSHLTGERELAKRIDYR